MLRRYFFGDLMLYIAGVKMDTVQIKIICIFLLMITAPIKPQLKTPVPTKMARYLEQFSFEMVSVSEFWFFFS